MFTLALISSCFDQINDFESIYDSAANIYIYIYIYNALYSCDMGDMGDMDIYIYI